MKFTKKPSLKRLIFYLLLIIFSLLLAYMIYYNYAPVKPKSPEIEAVEKHLNSVLDDKVTYIELFRTIHNDAWVDTNVFGFDGAVFWDGKDEYYPATDVLFFRAYSPKLSSYVFLQYNDRYDNKDYYIYENYNNELGKQKATELFNGVSELLSSKGVVVLQSRYCRYSKQSENLDEVYRLPKDYFDDYEYLETSFKNNVPTFAIFWIDGDLDDISPYQEELCELSRNTNGFATLNIITNSDEQMFVSSGYVTYMK